MTKIKQNWSCDLFVNEAVSKKGLRGNTKACLYVEHGFVICWTYLIITILVMLNYGKL